MEKSQKEFEHNEKACENIKTLRGKIRKLAYETKFKIHRVDACIDYFSDMSKIGIWKRKHFEIMKEALEECIEKIVELTSFVIGDVNTGNSYISEMNQLIVDSFDEIRKTARVKYIL